jgi:hypothetical protein
VALAGYVRENVANPTSTILWGGSQWTVISLETAERNGGAFDGYLAMASVGAEAPRPWDQALVLRLAYDVTFGMPSSWGTPGDVRDDLDYETEVAPLLSGQVSDAATFGWFEFIRLVAGIPARGLPRPPGSSPASSHPVFL